MNLLTLWFDSEQNYSLSRSEFYYAHLNQNNRSVRGKTAGALKGHGAALRLLWIMQSAKTPSGY